MPALDLALDLAPLRRPLRASVDFARRLGVRGIELDGRGELRLETLSETGLRQVRKMLDDAHLRVVAIQFRTRRGYAEPEDLDRRVAATQGAMRLAAQLRAPFVVNSVGRVPSDPDSAEFGRLVEVLSDLGRFGQRQGVTLAARTGSESGADLARLVAAVPEGLLCVALDPGQLLVNGQVVLDAVAELGDRIWYAYANDGVADRARGRGLQTALGRGQVDYPALLGALEDRGYRGPWCLTRDGGDDAETELVQAAEYLRNL
jgi:sugar phosphate isomerase/epimerase